MNKIKGNSGKNDIIVGRNSVLEALKAGKEIDTIYYLKGDRQGSIHRILAMAKDRNIVVKDCNEDKLRTLSEGASHQGIAAIAAAAQYATVSDMLQLAKEQGVAPFLILADEIEDPHNLGALIRTAEACGAHGMIIPKRRNASLTQTVNKTSAGALNHFLVARVSNLAMQMDQLKEQGFWIYGADMNGSLWCRTEYSGPVALVVGSEGKGMGKLIKEKCDFLISLPMYGQVSSLNASVAGGIMMYEIARQRNQLNLIGE